MAFRFEHLEIWRLAIDYGEKVHGLTKRFPRSELFVLTSDLNRAALSVSANIAEGSGSDSNKEFVRFLNIALKSALETVSQLWVARRRGYITSDEFRDAYQDAELLVKKIRCFVKSLK